MTTAQLCGQCGYCSLPLVPCIACDTFGASYHCYVCAGTGQMRPWAYEIGGYPEHDVYNVEVVRILKNFVLHQNPVYLAAKEIICNYDDVLVNNPGSTLEQLTAIYNEYRNAVDVVNSISSNYIGPSEANTCLNRMGQHVRRLIEPERP